MFAQKHLQGLTDWCDFAPRFFLSFFSSEEAEDAGQDSLVAVREAFSFAPTQRSERENDCHAALSGQNADSLIPGSS